MMTDPDVINRISALANSIGIPPDRIDSLAESGSSRKYFRVFSGTQTFIGTYNANVEENEAFFYLTKHFGNCQLPVPKLLAVSEEGMCYLQTDEGDDTLFRHVISSVAAGKYDNETIALFRQALDQLVRFQVVGHQGLDYGKVYPVPCFDPSAVMDDLDYFKYYFVKPHPDIVFNETKLKADFQAFAEVVGQADNNYFMYRDFQSRNIMVHQGKVLFIDYQGGRKGPLPYDVVSLLYQVKAQMPQALRDELLSYYKQSLSAYVDVEKSGFDRFYPYFVYLRLMQVLGAYGFRGLIQKKTHFIESIPFAINELRLWSETHPLTSYPALQNVIQQVCLLLPRYAQAAGPNAQLTVVVNSFSFRKGYPDDFSGNGGGFVFDCRALPNPGREPEFKTKTGRDWEVVEYLMAKPQVHEFLEHVKGIVGQSIDNYLERHFSHLMVSFGCTGGQHRSVFFAQTVSDWIRQNYPSVKVKLNHIEQHIHE